jgi:integrase/recombinase XerD
MGIQSLDRTELTDLLRAAKRKRERDWLMILVAFHHGLRASEVIALTPDNFHKGELTVARLKGSLQTTQALVEHADPLLDEKNALFEFLRGKPRNQRLFKLTRVRFWQLVQEYGVAAGIAKHKRHPHILKHSIAMQTIQKAGVENVRVHLGHKSLSSTGAYLKKSDKEASAAVRSALED